MSIKSKEIQIISREEASRRKPKHAFGCITLEKAKECLPLFEEGNMWLTDFPKPDGHVYASPYYVVAASFVSSDPRLGEVCP